MRKVEMKKILIIGVVFFVLALVGMSWGDDPKQDIEIGDTQVVILETTGELKAYRMEIAVELQLLQLEAQGIVDRMKVLQIEARKLAPKIEKLKKEFMDLTDKINKN